MLAIVLTAFLSAQDPMAATCAVAGHDDATQVVGTTELDPLRAFESAQTAVQERARQTWEERANRLAHAQLPAYLPELFVQQAVRRFLQNQPVERTLQVVDRSDREREHEFGNSWQTTLWVVEDARASAQCERQLRSDLRRTERQLLFKSGGTVVFWASLTLLLGWIDRLSRGYMTWRLRSLGLLLGAGVPVVAFLL